MAVTASPPFDLIALARFLAESAEAGNAIVNRPALLAGGAIRENWGFTAIFDGGRLDGHQKLVLRTDAATGIASSLSRAEEFAVLKAVYAAGVAAPEPLFVCADDAVIGKPFFVMRCLPGTPQGRTITSDPALETVSSLAFRLGEELAHLQTVRPARPDLAFLPAVGALEHIAAFRAYLDRHPNPRPVLEWAIRWIDRHTPAPLPPVLCHRDFRTGNYLVDHGELTGILDWEFAGWGDPDEDIGWFCCKGWRFARLDREAGGIAGREPFYAGYEAASGRRLDPERVRFWEVLANVRWAVIALQQSDRYLLGGARDLSTAIIGRRATECELELLMLLDETGPPASCRYAGVTPAIPNVSRDLPSPGELLALGREWLLEELLPLIPPDRERELRLVATAMAIAEREEDIGPAMAREIEVGLEQFYGFAYDDPLRRLAADLRGGAFEPCGGREAAARAVLWRLTIGKLRMGNPQFLAANGFGG